MMEDDSHCDPSQPPAIDFQSITTFVWSFEKNLDLLAVSLFAIALVKGPLRQGLRGVLNRLQKQRIKFTMLLVILECVGRVWGWLMDQFLAVAAFFWGLIDRGSGQKNARMRELPDLLSDEDETPIETLTETPATEEHAPTLPCPHKLDGNSDSQLRKPRDVIEPAFLNENEYPKDWLVYHPVLRVVLKTVADRYDQGESIDEAEGSGSDMEEKKEEASEKDESSDGLEVQNVQTQETRRIMNEHPETGHDRISPKSPCPSPTTTRGSPNEVFPVQHSVAAN